MHMNMTIYGKLADSSAHCTFENFFDLLAECFANEFRLELLESNYWRTRVAAEKSKSKVKRGAGLHTIADELEANEDENAGGSEESEDINDAEDSNDDDEEEGEDRDEDEEAVDEPQLNRPSRKRVFNRT